MDDRAELIKELGNKFTWTNINWREILADFIISREKRIRQCEFCGSNDLVCGKAWKDEREKLLEEMQRIRNNMPTYADELRRLADLLKEGK